MVFAHIHSLSYQDFDNQDLHNKELYLFCEVIRICKPPLTEAYVIMDLFCSIVF